MSFIDFLLKYYIWILGVLIVLILIVIGVLVESKSKEKGEKKEKNKKATTTLAEVQNPENITTTSSVQPGLANEQIQLENSSKISPQVSMMN